MAAKLKMMVAVCVVMLMVTVEALAVGVPAKITITSWTNTKTGDADLIFPVGQGNEITFTVNADDVNKYEWRVNRSVQASQTAKSFTWTVPSEQSTWNISVILTSSGKRSDVTWSVTTSTLVTIQPGNSIQTALDSLPDEGGGIVELAAGQWNLGATPIHVTTNYNDGTLKPRGNITLRGAGMDQTKLVTGGELGMIRFSPYDKDTTTTKILEETMGGRACLNVRNDLKAGLVIYTNNIELRDFALEGSGVRSSMFKDLGILGVLIDGFTVSNVRMEKTGNGLYPMLCDNSVYEGCYYFNLNQAGLYLQYSNNSLVENNRFERCQRWYAVDLNGACCGNSLINNSFVHNEQGDMKIYSASNTNQVIGNLFDGDGSSHVGVYILASAENLVQGNVFAFHRNTPWGVITQRVHNNPSHPPAHYAHDNKIIGNVIYGVTDSSTSCNSNAIEITLGGGGLMEIRNNIIVNNVAKSLAVPANDPDNPELAGQKCDYSNIWGNGENTGMGTGAISADPLFADPTSRNFYLKSKTGRWDPSAKTWIKDSVHSPCIDTGKPSDDCSNEPSPNGSRINMGAYGNTDKASKSETAETVGRYVFYNNSIFDGDNAATNADDDGAIAPDKTALLPGGTATFANYTSYSRGINGIMVDIAGLSGTPIAADFTFKGGNDNTPGSWATAPAPTSITVREGAGVNGSDRITIVWTDNAIQKQWLQVTVKATDATGLASDDVFYFGNAIGETGNSATDAKVGPTDEIDARNNPHTAGGNPADIDDAYDFNRDKKVGPTDEIIARNNGTNSSTALKLITVP